MNIILHNRIDEILFYQWDPIGVSDSNWPRDEYKLYVNKVLDLAVNNTTAQPLAEYLTYLSTEIIQSTVSNERTCKVAELIFSIAHDRAYYPDHAVITVD